MHVAPIVTSIQFKRSSVSICNGALLMYESYKLGPFKAVLAIHTRTGCPSSLSLSLSKCICRTDGCAYAMRKTRRRIHFPRRPPYIESPDGRHGQNFALMIEMRSVFEPLKGEQPNRPMPPPLLLMTLMMALR